MQTPVSSVTAHAQSTSTTHFSCSSKCRRTSLYKSYHRVFDFSNQKARVRALTFTPPYITLIQFSHSTNPAVFINISPKTSPLFAAIHLFISSHDEIKDFCSMDKKTGRRYGCACYFIHKLFSQNPPQIISHPNPTLQLFLLFPSLYLSLYRTTKLPLYPAFIQILHPYYICIKLQTNINSP